MHHEAIDCRRARIPSNAASNSTLLCHCNITSKFPSCSSQVPLCILKLYATFGTRSSGTSIRGGDCANGFDQDDKNRTVEDGQGIRYCFKRDVSCIDYNIKVKTTKDDEVAKLLVVIMELDKINDDWVPDILDDIKHFSICSDVESCNNEVGVSSRREYAILVINNNHTDPEFNEAFGEAVNYRIDISGMPHFI